MQFVMDAQGIYRRVDLIDRIESRIRERDGRRSVVARCFGDNIEAFDLASSELDSLITSVHVIPSVPGYSTWIWENDDLMKGEDVVAWIVDPHDECSPIPITDVSGKAIAGDMIRRPGGSFFILGRDWTISEAELRARLRAQATTTEGAA